ncbi:uncharacterized protein [Ptychodera flava]|uniref:uncharacterized protein n=1 Tax=Ptychodera flava TaxID=63121 RepID=UPI00396A98CD
MCKDELLRRQVLSTFPPISVAGNARSRSNQGGLAESLSLYSKTKSSNGWSSGSSSNSAVLPAKQRSPRKQLTARLETPRPGDRAADERLLGLQRNKTSLSLDTRILEDKSDSPLTARTSVTTTQAGADKRRRESSSSNASSLPKMAPKKKVSVSTVEEITRPLQREMTVIIRYEEDKYTESRQNLHERKLSFQPTLETALEGDEDYYDTVGFLEPTKSRTIIEWLEACERARHDTEDEQSDDSADRLPVLVEINNTESQNRAETDFA